ncbi:MAG: hypothetical protein M1826_001381 [Phylliscum demangeonii]|nr:MAG: hypothetical protein M1826_001381 [Phylliscum demangeonii]
MDKSLYKRQATLAIPCNEIPEICNTMCWGAYCTRPAFGTTLYYDKPSAATKSKRRTAAGCGSANRCSVIGNPPNPIAGLNCDEYPFASTSNADRGGQVNRCVPKAQNDRQGNLLAAYYRNVCGNAPCSFTVTFAQPTATGVLYCGAVNSPRVCNPDGNIFKGRVPDDTSSLDTSTSPDTSSFDTSSSPDTSSADTSSSPDTSSTDSSVFKRDTAAPTVGGFYLTESGVTISSPEDLAPGSPINHVRRSRNGAEIDIVADKISHKL